MWEVIWAFVWWIGRLTLIAGGVASVILICCCVLDASVNEVTSGRERED